MANDKFYGYKPKKEKTEPNKGIPGSGNRLDRVNPYEFRKGMDYELASAGVERLKEADLDQREKATEAVLKNLEEHGGFYSALIQFNAGMNQGGTIKESSFKEYLKNYTSKRGDGMEEIKNAFKTGKMKDADHKNDKMTEPKYDKKDYTVTLKEAIKKEVQNILKENEEPPKSAKKDPSGLSGVKLQKEVEKAKKDIEKLNTQRDELFQKFKKKKQGKSEERKKDIDKEYIDKVKEAGLYKSKGDAIPSKLDHATEYLDKLKKIQEEKVLEEKELRREIATTMMEKKTHLSLLEIIKEAGAPMNEGAAGVKMYYEIAKTSYMEGMMSGLNK